MYKFGNSVGNKDKNSENCLNVFAITDDKSYA